MSNETIFYTQISSIVLFIIALFVLYRLLVEKKEATIQFLEKQLQAAKEQSPDIVLKKLNERVQIARDEMERLSKDREMLVGMNEQASRYIESLEGVVRADKELIELLQGYQEENHGIFQEYADAIKKDMFDVFEKIEEAADILVHKNERGVVQKVTVTLKETPEPTSLPTSKPKPNEKQ
jgi:DNA integrity scanning protein DisA with diadenylate cyclase activity